jgi:hypothetical protein
MLCASTVSFSDEIPELPIDAMAIITECGIQVQIPKREYTQDEIERLIDYYTKKLCNQSADGPLP